MTTQNILTGIVIEESTELTLADLSHACGMPAEWILSLIEEGVLEPIGTDQAHWHFHGQCLRHVRIVQRLQSDLGINLAGAALALDLLEEIQTLRRRLAALEK